MLRGMGAENAGGAAIDERAIEDAAAKRSFTGVATVDVGDERVYERLDGFAHRALRVPHTPSTRIAIASGSKTFTALAVLRLVEEGVLTLGTRVRGILGTDLPLIDDAVTVGQLLAHRSGIGDYLDEELLGDMNDYVMTVPVHQLDSTEAFLAALGGFPQVSTPGTTFVYNNGGFVVLSLIAERAAGRPYHALVRERVIRPAGLTDSDFLRSDARPADVAIGYLHPEGLRSNVLHMPVVGVGDGGITSSAEDLHRLWAALRDGRVVPPEWAARVTSPSGDFADGEDRYGLGVWLSPTDGWAQMVGADAGISAVSTDDPTTGVRWTVISNWTDGAWPIVKALRDPIAAAVSS
jgi:CubicO group peptidase (beta-lactamase class C family)